MYNNRAGWAAVLLFALCCLVSASLAKDYAFRIERIGLNGARCHILDDGQGEDWVWKFEVSGTGMAKCFLRQTNDDDVNAVATSPNWDINFSTSKTEIQVEFETYEKDADGDYCVWSPTQDDVGQRAAETRTFGLTSLEEGQSFDWEFRGKMPDDDCIMVAFGKITRFASDAQPGSPRITSTSLAISGGKLQLTIEGRELNPDPDEKPVVQIFGPQMSCIDSTMSIANNKITCTLTSPESDQVSNMETQLQVQTVYGVTRQATVSFPRCSPSCQNNGTCWWSKDAGALECVCSNYLYYGAQCQNKYPEGEPVLQAVSPIGGDYTKDIVIAVSGRAYPDSDPSIETLCEVSWSGTNQRVAASGDRIETVRDVVWSGPLVAYDRRPIAQADSLTLQGLCILPAGTFPKPSADKKEAMVTLIWRRNATQQVIASRDSRRFLLYGPFYPASSTVQVVANEADGEVRVFRDQTLRVTLADADGNNRVGGEDSDIFSLSWHDGPSSEPLFGIKGGDAKAFRYSECRRKPDNPTCAYYELTLSFDFAGKFKGDVFTTDPTSLALVSINKAEVIFDVKGLGEVALPVPSRAPSSIAWADQLKDRTKIPLFNKGLAQLISPNTGAKDRANVLGPLFQRWKGGWFTQRQTVSLGLETALSQATLGSVHVIRGQGINEPAFCDAHTDELDAGALAKTITPWQSKGNVPGTFPMVGLGFSDGDCITSIVVNVELVHRNPDSVGLVLTRKGMPNTNPRAKNTTIDIVLKTATSSSASLGSGVPSPTVLQYRMGNVPRLAALKGLPALADWVLTVSAPASRGHITKWYIDIQSEYCLKSSVIDNSICGFGGGQLYARASNEEDIVRLECPQGGVISKIEWARFGKLEGSCEDDTINVYDDCEANRAIVEQRVGSVCLGHTSCELAALDTQFAEEIGEPYLCPGELPPCPDEVSLVAADESSSGSAKRKRDREHHSKERELPWTYPGTEDHYFKNTHVRHVTEPYFRPRRASDAPTCTYSAVRPKKALMVKAVCADSNAAFKSLDSPPVEKRMLMTSASADFDNDWKDETVTLFGYEGGALHVAFTYLEASKPTTAVYKSITIGGEAVVLGGQIEAHTGDFDNDGYPELVFGFIDGKTGALRVYLWDLAIDDAGVWGAGNNKLSRTNLQACGCFDRTAIMRNLFDSASLLTVPNDPIFPVIGSNGVRLDSHGFSFSLTAGDVGTFGFDMLAVAWIVDGSTVAWSLYQQDENAGLAPVTSEPMSLRSLKRPHAVSINLADYEGSGSSEIALGVVDDSEVRVYLYAIDQLEEGFPMKQSKVLTVYPSSSPALWGSDTVFAQRINLRMVSGDLDDDGDAEVVVGFTTDDQAYIYRIDAPGTGTKCRRLDCMQLFGRYEYGLPLASENSGAPTRSRELRMAIGNVDDTYANELLVAVEYTSSADPSVHKIMLTSLTAQPNVDDPFAINGRHCYKGPHYQEGEQLDVITVNNMALTVGNLYGLGFRVGEPITVRYEGVPELIAVLNAPPTHYDVLDGADVIVNPGTFHGAGSFSQLSNIEGVVSNFEVTRETASATTNSHGFQLNAKIAVVFGNVDLAWQKFKSNSENTGLATTEQIAVARDVVASGDDSVLFISTDKDVWKYPIVDQNGNQVGTLDIVLSSSCGERCVQKADGRDLWWFTPDHEPFNVLTYPARAPRDFNPANRIMVGEKVTMGPNAHEQWVDQQSGRSQNKVTLNHSADKEAAGGSVGVSVGVDYIFSGAFMGIGPQIKLPIGISVSAGYAGRTEKSDEKMDSATSSASINRDASVHSYLEAISPMHAYRVQPYVYIARTMAGQEYLKVDYSAEPGYYPGVSNWWQRKYGKPDPTFNMPWWWTTFKRDKTMLTKEIVATPPFPKLGEVVQVTVTVRNKAMVQAVDVGLSLWRGSPENCLDLNCMFPGRTLIGSTRINIIPAQDQRDINFMFKFDGTNNIHATIDDKDEVDETHEDNNHGYNLVFHNLRDEGYTLQNVALDKTIGLKPVKGGPGKAWTKGYDVTVTVLGDTFTRQNVLVQLWYGGVGGSGRLISTINVPRIRGSVRSTTRYTLSAFWDTSNTALYGEREIHAVILHSGFDTSPDNIVSHVVQTVNVGCYGEVDVCGVCGGDNSLCAGCDGVPLSGKTVDICGKCGGDGSTCCVRRPSQASIQYVRLGDDASSKIKRVKVGDMIVWENMLDWNVKIEGGVFDYVGAPTFELETLKNRGFDIHDPVPPMTLDEETVNAYVQKYLTTVIMKDHQEPDGTNPSVPTPVPDATSKYLKRSAMAVPTAVAAGSPLDSSDDVLGLSRFPGWHVDEPTRHVTEARLRALREVRQESRRSESHYFSDDEEKEDDELIEDFAMNGICCADPDYDDDVDTDVVVSKRDQSAQRQSERASQRRQAALDEQRRQLARQQLQRNAKAARNNALAPIKAGSLHKAAAFQPAFSLRKLALSMLESRKRQLDHLDALLLSAANSSTTDDVQTAAAQRKRDLLSESSYYEPQLVDDDIEMDEQALLDQRVRCLCHNSRKRNLGEKAAEGGKTADGGEGDKGAAEAKPKTESSEGAPAAPEPPKPEDNGEASFGEGELGAPEVGTGASMQMTTSYGVQTFSGFGAARGWATYDFAELAKTADGDPTVMGPGAASAPHRFFSPGLYVWHDSNNPALHGIIIVDPSDLQRDVCGVCGGNGTTCLDCKGKPFGKSRRDVCGVCFDPFVDPYNPDKAKDCAGVCNGTAVIDECGFCTGGSTGRLAGFAKDCMGMCNGSAPEYCGVCGADRDTHAYLADCAGECGGPRKLNPCGYCVGGDTGLDLSYGMDCSGTCNGTAERDCTGVCLGTTKIDCADVCGGSAKINPCLRCVGGSSGLDDAMTKTCDGVCAITESEVCGFSSGNDTSTKRFATEETETTADDLIGERQACGGVVDKRGTCCAANELDCANLCRGSATIECNVCVGGSSGKDVSEFKDCKGVCNGTARYNPCGICATPDAYHNGTGYTVDCNNVCNGSAYYDSCNVCVEGSTGVSPNVNKDCQGTCFGNATTDDCGVCYLAGDGFEPNSWQDCAGVCNGTAVIDDCGACTLGTTRREFNADKDCAGQCYGQHVITDPACSCPAGQLDQCFVCGGNNTQCAGCDGIPWSGTKRDFCGVCGGNNTACCFLSFAQTSVTIRDFEAIILRDSLETGETLAITNLHAGYAYTLIMYRLDVPADVARVKQIQTRWDYATLRPGNTLSIVIQEPGIYRLTSVESSSVTFTLRVTYNSKKLDICGRCVYTDAKGGTVTNSTAGTRDATEYDHCCAIMPNNNVHEWFETTFFFELARPEHVTRVVPHTDHYTAAPGNHLVRLVEPQMIDAATWWSGKKIEVGDVLVLENRDSLAHVISFSGPQPLPDVLLERGTTVATSAFLKPGTYRLLSNKNLINTSFTVEFPFSCSVYDQEPLPAEDDHKLLIVLTTVLGGSFLVLVVVALLAIGAAAVIYKCTRPSKVETHSSAMYPL